MLYLDLRPTLTFSLLQFLRQGLDGALPPRRTGNGTEARRAFFYIPPNMRSW
jgi:hypothetical protein